MSKFLKQAIVGVSVITCFTLSLGKFAAIALFDQVEMNQSRVIAIAVPRNLGGHQLLVLEQISSTRDCWRESGANPTLVDPLLLNFDFTGICGRATDSNGYSLRMGGVDLGLQYTLSLQSSGGDVQLVATPRDPQLRRLTLGRTRGTRDGFLKIILEPGWRFTKRSYQGKVLGHYYFTNDSTSPGTPSPSPSPTPLPSPSPTPTPPTTTYPFPDIRNDIYANEIKEAADIGFVAGFEDNTFRPQATLTREQAVSIVLEALRATPGVNMSLPLQTTTAPYPDVAANRWSAAKIRFARDNNIISGYTDGTFKPTQTVTRAELMAMLRRGAEYALRAKGRTPTLTAKNAVTRFSDTQNHWAASLIEQMSAYCKVASPVNEVGTRFEPDSASRRNYATAATLRMMKCVQ